MRGINIYSGAGGLGSALTNPTELAFQKGAIRERYPIRFGKRRWPDVETAYQTLKGEGRATNDRLMAELIAAKFLQYPDLLAQVKERGGRAFLEACEHFTGARSERSMRQDAEEPVGSSHAERPGSPATIELHVNG